MKKTKNSKFYYNKKQKQSMMIYLIKQKLKQKNFNKI